MKEAITIAVALGNHDHEKKIVVMMALIDHDHEISSNMDGAKCPWP